MKIFFAFLVINFLIALTFRNAARGWRSWFLLAMCLLVCFAYFFLRKI